MIELTLSSTLVLVASGLVAGVVNTLAGGGSNLTVPALLILGLPADLANGTNRVAVLLQCLVGTHGFDRSGALARDNVAGILVLLLVGSGSGALMASYLPNLYLKPVLLLAMIGMATAILLKPDTLGVAPGTAALRVRDHPRVWLPLLLVGVYGGFVQAGVGLILIGVLAGCLRYDLVRASALKMLCTGVLTLLALGVFVLRDQVVWAPGLVLSAGSMAGAWLGVRFAIRMQSRTLRGVVFAMTVTACAAALIS